MHSVPSMAINPVQLREMYEKHPNINRVSIFQCKKEGKFYGQNTYGHDVDTIIKVVGAIATIDGKNRFGSKGEIVVF